MRVIAGLPVGLRVALAVAFLAVAAFGWIWTASQAGDISANLVVAIALLLLVLGGILILSLPAGGNVLAEMIGRWPAMDTDARLPAGSGM